jgi:hypothetical protein
MNGRLSSAKGRVIHNIIVDKCKRMQQLDGRGGGEPIAQRGSNPGSERSEDRSSTLSTKSDRGTHRVIKAVRLLRDLARQVLLDLYFKLILNHVG